MDNDNSARVRSRRASQSPAHKEQEESRAHRSVAVDIRSAAPHKGGVRIGGGGKADGVPVATVGACGRGRANSGRQRDVDSGEQVEKAAHHSWSEGAWANASCGATMRAKSTDFIIL